MFRYSGSKFHQKIRVTFCATGITCQISRVSLADFPEFKNNKKITKRITKKITKKITARKLRFHLVHQVEHSRLKVKSLSSDSIQVEHSRLKVNSLSSDSIQVEHLRLKVKSLSSD